MGKIFALNFDSGVLARVGVEDTVVNNIKNRKVFDVESSSSYVPADACTYERECAAIDYDVRGLTGQSQPDPDGKMERFGGFFELNSSTYDYEAMFGEVDSQINQKICQLRKVAKAIGKHIELRFYKFFIRMKKGLCSQP